MKHLLTLLLLASCQDYNSNSADRERYGKGAQLEDNAQFQEAYAVLQTRCITCHTHAAWAEYTTSAKWVASGKVIKGNSQGSPLIRRIINSNDTDSNMPLNGSALPNDEYDALVEWVDNLP